MDRRLHWGWDFWRSWLQFNADVVDDVAAEHSAAIRSRAGAACESSLIQDMGADAVQNLQVYPRLPNGDLAIWWFTADGVCSRYGDS